MMAKIFPERLPQSVLNDPFRSAERKVYERLGKLSDKFTVYYSVPWQTHSGITGVKDGETDFVIVHPEYGVVILEVKGGDIAYDASRNQWLTTGGIEIKDPVEQGRKSKYALLEKLQALPSWDPSRFINIGHAVCFPTVNVKERSVKPDLPREIILDRKDLDDISVAVQRLFAHLFGKSLETGAPGNDRRLVIEKLLASSFQLRTPLGVELEHEDAKLIELTDLQMMALSLLGNQKRAAISGCAGSGKTMLAVEKAMRLQELGLNVLLTCFNIPLSNYLQKRLSGTGITIQNFHTFAEELVGQTGGALPPNSSTEREYYDKILPELLWDTAMSNGPMYDAIVVDEGQDFRENYWIALEALLKPDGYLYVFYDDNQNLYGGVHGFSDLITTPSFPLNQNCRNTRMIHDTVVRFHNNPSGMMCRGPDGRPPEVVSYETEAEFLRILQKLLHQLVNEESIRTQDIIVLTPRAQEKSILKVGRKLGNFSLTLETPQSSLEIQTTSIHRFKGLERCVVILGELDHRYTYNPDMVMYVGCSRARTQLYILHGSRASSRLLSRLQNSK